MTKSTSTKNTPEQQLQKLTAKYFKAKAKLQQASAKEASLRMDIQAILVKQGADSSKVTLDHNTNKLNTVNDVAVTFTRRKNYSIPKAAITDIRDNIKKKVFDDVFTTSYKLKPTVYEKLTGACREKIMEHLTIKDSPLSATIKEVE